MIVENYETTEDGTTTDGLADWFFMNAQADIRDALKKLESFGYEIIEKDGEHVLIKKEKNE